MSSCVAYVFSCCQKAFKHLQARYIWMKGFDGIWSDVTFLIVSLSLSRHHQAATCATSTIKGAICIHHLWRRNTAKIFRSWCFHESWKHQWSPWLQPMPLGPGVCPWRCRSLWASPEGRKPQTIWRLGSPRCRHGAVEASVPFKSVEVGWLEMFEFCKKIMDHVLKEKFKDNEILSKRWTHQFWSLNRFWNLRTIKWHELWFLLTYCV